MSLNAWNQLQDLEKSIDSEFSAPNAAVAACPAGPQVHLICAHYAARPNVDKQAANAGSDLPTLPRYEAGKSSGETPSQNVALAFFAAHFLWMRTPGVVVDKLPQPPLVASPAPTDAKDGGTVAHFTSNNWPPHPKNDHGDTVPFKVKVTTPALLDDPTFVEGYAATAGAPAIETSEGYPKTRTLCMAVTGSDGDHKVVTAASGPITAELAYNMETTCGSLRTFAVSPGFAFETRPKPAKRAHGKNAPPPPPTPAPTKITTDPWKTSTRDLTGNPSVWETSSVPEVTLGGVSAYTQTHHPKGKPAFTDTTHGIAKGSGPGRTSINDILPKLAPAGGKSPLGRHRQLIFKAFNDIEGPAEALNTYDTGILSWGINQWTAAQGELRQLVCFISDFYPAAFARRFGYYGIGAWFSGRSKSWEMHSAYKKDPTIYRVPCCGSKISAAIDAIATGWKKADQQALAAAQADAKRNKKPIPSVAPALPADLPPRHLKPLADAVVMVDADFASLAACYVFTTAGGDVDVQRAQAQWMSFRISWTKAHSDARDATKATKPANGQAIDSTLAPGKSLAWGTFGAMVGRFIESLGAVGEERNKRHAHARQNLIAAVGADKLDALLDETYDDSDTDESWKDWATACKNAGKTMT